MRGEQAEQDDDGLVFAGPSGVAEERRRVGKIAGRAQHPVQVDQPLGVARRVDQEVEARQQGDLRLGERSRDLDDLFRLELSGDCGMRLD